MEIDKIAKTVTGAADIWGVEFGASYHVRVPDTGEHWAIVKIANDCGVDSIEPLEVPDEWDDSYEYATGDTHIWPRIARLARDANLANADLVIALVPVVDKGTDADSCALLYRFVWPY